MYGELATYEGMAASAILPCQAAVTTELRRQRAISRRR